ncbi:metal-dependent hydrolase [Paenibacillus sp. SN-8-1]|uniref:metal-dependent hydrolase n=1 Tax=Paenibacillus sp. SN-8-1 TaxID=3435409 RepID=UPI003D9A6CA7
MQIQFHGHSCIQVTEGEHSIIIDPYLTGNPTAVTNAKDIHVQHVILTHGHFDHITDASAIAKQNDASIIAVEELAIHLGREGLRTEAMHVGGEWEFDFGHVHLTGAAHTSSITTRDGEVLYAGVPVGIVLRMGDVTLYHAGDTGLFGDMKWIGERFDIDIAFLPIGGRFTMGPKDALTAAEWLKARCVVPIHFDTFPPIRQDGHAFVSDLARLGIQGRCLAPGETITI